MSKNQINRRSFLKGAGAAGLGSVIASRRLTAAEKKEEAKEKKSLMPTRKLGKTGVKVPILSLGTMYNLIDNQIMLRRTLDMDVNYWDTAYVYARGNSEKGIGKFLERNSEVRKKVFITSKASGADTPEEVEERLQESMKRMNTDYIDLYYCVHGIEEPDQLTPEIKEWVADAKKRGVIKYAGVTTHENIAVCLKAAAKCEWLDAVMPVYNFRLMQEKDMQEAVEACHKAGLGLIAMKTIAEEQIKTEKDKELAGHFLERGFTQGQAKIKAVLSDERFSSACVGMKTIQILNENVAAALDKTELAQSDMEFLKAYADDTCSGYCAGCSRICQGAVPEVPYISKIMRYLMYYKRYGDKEMARELFAEIPASVRNKLTSVNYKAAQARCPHHMPIGKLMAEAAKKLA
ncbi:MAG: aldo/keto reductase [Planctomycetota bacterium]|jgi:predicted aldo/keto reductase-like oxidoreductase